MEALRWILLLIGLVLIAGIYWLGRRRGQDERREGLFERARRAASADKGDDGAAAEPVEPDLDIGDIDLQRFDVEDRPGGDTRETPERSTSVGGSSDRDEAEATGAGSHPPDRHHGAPAEPREAAETRWSADPRAESGSVTRQDPEGGRETVPGSDLPHEPEPEPEWSFDPEPPVTRAQTPEKSAHNDAAPAHTREAIDTEPVASAERRREEREQGERTPGGGSGERVVVLHVVAAEGERLVGARLREALESCGMRHGAFSIFHASDSEGSIVFSAANAVEPGTFDRTTMDTLTTPGVALFMQVPGAQSAETVFERMLSTARSVADALDAHVLDERHSTLTRQTEQHLREELRLLDRRLDSLQR